MRLIRACLVLALLLAGNAALALGLGEIRLNSALNEPLRARIELLSATPEELESLKVQLASSATFERYGIDRPLWLTRLQFNVVSTGGGAIEIRSQEPVTEPFVTFLVEATWPAGRLLREYTVLLDPPTFAPPPATEAREAVTAPSRAAPADAGRIERPAPAPATAPAARQPAADTGPFDATAGDDVQVQRGDTLWGIAQRVRPDDRLSMNQTMLAIYQANPDAFAGNINRLEAGARLRIPSADDIFRISRNDALSEVQRQNQDAGLAGPAPRTQPSLTLVPPDGDQQDVGAGTAGQEPSTARQAELQQRIRELEGTVADQQSLIEVRDNELAQLRQELARMREQAAAAGQPLPQEPQEPQEPAEQPVTPEDEAADEVFVDDTGDIAAEDEVAADEDEPAADEEPAPAEQPSPRVVRTAPDEPGLVDRIIGMLTSIWGIIGLALLVAVAVLLWFAKRAAGREEESTGVWEALDSEDDEDVESRASTERLRALARDDDASIVVVEQESALERRRRPRDKDGDTVEVPQREALDETAGTGAMPAFDDTFSSETAINLDQSDPIAEADFHMAYGLYDQAADLINGALAIEPERQDLMAKLAEIYFVWGNRDAFVEAAERLDDQLGGEGSPDWDKIVIMGQQIAPDHRLFAGASAAGATRAVDLSFDESGDSNVLDMDFDAGGPDGAVSDVFDVGEEEEETRADQSGLDFVFDEDTVESEAATGATTTREMPKRPRDEDTLESPTIESEAAYRDDERDSTLESPTIESEMESPHESLDSTSELPAFRDRDREPQSAEETAEIDLDDLGLDLDALAKSGLEDIEGDFGVSDLEETSENRVLASDEETGRNERLDVDLDSTSEMPLADEETGRNRAVVHDRDHEDTDVEFDSSLLDATGHTQVLSDDFGVGRDPGDEDATMLASLDEQGDDEETRETGAFSRDDMDFDFAETEALPKDTFGRSQVDESGETGEMPKPGQREVDLDLDDLTAALRVSEGDTVDQPRDEATVEQPIRGGRGYDDDDTPTEALSPDDLSDDLHDARTMTEVGTKLDLARAYVDMGDPEGARSILEEVLDEGDEGQRQQAQKLIDSLPG